MPILDASCNSSIQGRRSLHTTLTHYPSSAVTQISFKEPLEKITGPRFAPSIAIVPKVSSKTPVFSLGFTVGFDDFFEFDEASHKKEIYLVSEEAIAKNTP